MSRFSRALHYVNPIPVLAVLSDAASRPLGACFFFPAPRMMHRSMPVTFPRVDVVGIGENATDTLLRVPRFPDFNSSLRILSSQILPGGQVATAMIACQTWGLHTRYFGKVGDDSAGHLQARELARAGVDAHLLTVAQCNSQSAYILVDASSGERTILFERDERLSHTPQEISREGITSGRVLHVDGHNAHTHALAAGWAREAGIPVVADVDNLYPGHKELLASVDYLVGSNELPHRLTGISSHLEALPAVAERFGNRLVATTLGVHGALSYEPRSRRFTYCPAFAIAPVDTTGAGDLFHAGFLYGFVQGWPLARILDFACAAAALNCLELGARGGIKSFAETEHFRTSAQRGPVPETLAQYNVLGHFE